MTMAEVEAIMERYVKEPPAVAGLVMYRWSDDAYATDVGFIRFVEGKVTGVEYRTE